MTRDQIFVSYSHADSEWLYRLQTMLAPLQRQGTLDVWADTRIQPGQLWKEKIQKALARASVAVLLVSPDFLASRFIHENELPPLLDAAQQGGLTIFWVPVRPSLCRVTDIARYQAAYNPATPLSTLAPPQQDAALVQIAEALMAIRLPSTPKPTSDLAPLASERDLLRTLREKMLTADSSLQLRSIKYELDHYLDEHPQTPEARLLKYQLVFAMKSDEQYERSVRHALIACLFLPAIPNIQGWSARELQRLQQEVSLALGLPAEFRDPLKADNLGPEMVVIPAGEFLMGTPKSEPERCNREGPQHKVEIAKSFAIGRYAVTFEDYDRFCEATGRDKPGDQSWGRGRRPVINVSWEDAVAYCVWLSQETGATYRLPSEAEWEYAARAGTTTPFWWGDEIDAGRANYGRNEGKTVPVGTFQPNPFGLYQVHGNVWEWVQDSWHNNYEGAPVDGSAWVEEGDYPCVLRGGSWGHEPEGLRGAARGGYHPHYRYYYGGFRLARTFP